MNTVKIAMIGVGAISGIYLTNMRDLFRGIELIGVCDLVPERAEAAQKNYGVPKRYPDMHAAFTDPGVDIVLNLTRPYEHFAVSKAALEAGKHVYSEKPLGATFEEGLALAELAKARGLRLGGAPDTFLGAGIQTCRKLIDDGVIGDVVGASCAMIGHGPESWHPDPAFFYKFGGGPMMDMGPYYITALVNLLGGVRGVTGVARKGFSDRVITSQPHFGQVVPVDVATHVQGILEFESGATANVLTTFDVWHKGEPRFEVYGTKGTLYVPDPNNFGGPIGLLRPEEGAAREMPLLFDYKENSRALGLADMAAAIVSRRPARADVQQTLHVLEVMTAFQKSSDSRGTVQMQTKYARAEAMGHGALHGVID